MLDLLNNDELDVKKEAVWMLSNSTTQATPQQIEQLVNLGLIEGLSFVLGFPDQKILIVALEGLQNVFEFERVHFQGSEGINRFTHRFEICGGLDRLERLQYHQNMQVYDRAIGIIENYFQV